jgi:protein O-mannosyl-transferase
MGKKNYQQKYQKQQKKNTPVVTAKKENKTGFFKNPKAPQYFLILIALASILVYAKAIGYGLIYNWDDAGYILKNEYIKSLNISSIIDIFSSFHLHNYHPLTTLSYALEYLFVGENAWLYHLNNLIVHLFNTYLVYLLMKGLFRGNDLPAILAAALFSLHPMHVESVAWVSERKDVLYTLFYLLALIRYLRFVEHGKRRELLMTGVFFLLSCMSKSAAVTLPVLLLAIDWYFRRKWSLAIIVEKIPFFLISLAFGILAILSQDTAIQDLNPMLSIGERLLIVCWGICLYIGKAIIPLELSAFYPYPLKFNDVLPWYYYLAPLFVVMLGIVLWISRKWGRELLFGFAFFFITISLVLQLMPVGGAIVAERYTYVPYLGLFFIMVWPLNMFYNPDVSLKRLKKIRVYLNFLLLLLLVFTYLSSERVKLWKDGDVLFTDVIEKYPLFPYAYNNRGFLYWDYYALKVYPDNEMKKSIYVEKALNDYNMAIQLDQVYSGAYANRAVLYYNTGNPQKALEDFNILLQLDPDNKDGLIGRANTLSTLGKFSESITDYNAYLQLNQDDPKAWLWRGIAYSKIGENEKAMSDFKYVVSVSPDDYEGHYWLGITLHTAGSFEQAVQSFNSAINLKPDNFEIFSWRGLAYYQLKQFENAVADYTKAIQLNPQELSSYINRSLAYNDLGMYQAAFDDLIFAAEKGMPISKEYYELLLPKVRR